jgi:metal-responsive CopG/Arc/MetJ family transcriptional regulator
MKVKTSISLSENLLTTIDQFADEYKNRSTFLETAAWAFIESMKRAERDRRDMEIIDQRADALNAEAMDVLGYQALL